MTNKRDKVFGRRKNGIRGEVPGCHVGQMWDKRVDVYNSGVHMQTMAGIDGRADCGCYSIVLSGGYDDDEDSGEEIIYTGCGGFDKVIGQIADQTFEGRNASLVVSFNEKFPVRVIRGSAVKSPYAPLSGYRYDGLYQVTEYWAEKKEFTVCRFKLKRLPGQVPLVNPREDYVAKPRAKRQMTRKVKSTPVALADDDVSYLSIPIEEAIERAESEDYCVICMQAIAGGCTPEHVEQHITELWNSFDSDLQEKVALRSVVNCVRISSVVDALTADDDPISLPTTSVFSWP